MTSTIPPVSPPPANFTSPTTPEDPQLTRLKTLTSLSALVLCPLIIALPPRKLDLYTIALLFGTGVSGTHVYKEYGPSLRGRFSQGNLGGGVEATRAAADSASDSNGATKAALRSASTWTRDITRSAAHEPERASRDSDGKVERKPSILSAVADLQREPQSPSQVPPEAPQPQPQPGRTAQAAGQNWKTARDVREKKALEEGRGYGDLIMDQIWEVWNWGRGGGDGGGEEGDGKR